MNINDDFYTLYNNGDTINENESDNNNNSKEDDRRQEIKEFGTDNKLNSDQSIQVLPIIGQIEGHMVLPPQTKATKYEHIIPQLISW